MSAVLPRQTLPAASAGKWFGSACQEPTSSHLNWLSATSMFFDFSITAKSTEIARSGGYARRRRAGTLFAEATDAISGEKSGAAVIACEDTRRTWQLLSHFGIPRPKEMFSYRQGNEDRVTERVVAHLKAGEDVALCSDGGYPGISDPGYRLLRTCAKEGVPYEVVPGACAVEVALLTSGLSTSSFTFRGFPPRGPGALRNWFSEDRDKEHTLVCYESPFRVAATLEAALDALGDREAAVCIELTDRKSVV